jgi:hypothetical protein
MSGDLGDKNDGPLERGDQKIVEQHLSLLAQWSGARLIDTARLWAVVLLANLVGAIATAALVTWAGLAPAAHVSGMLEVAHEFAANTPLEGLVLGIPAGFLVAVMVWLMPSAEGARFSIVVWLAYLIALGGFTHVVVGSAEVALLVFAGSIAGCGIRGEIGRTKGAERSLDLPPAGKRLSFGVRMTPSAISE